MDRTAKVRRARRKGSEVLRVVDSSGALSFAGAAHRVGNKHIRQVAGVRSVGDAVQITIDEALVRTHALSHDGLTDDPRLTEQLRFANLKFEDCFSPFRDEVHRPTGCRRVGAFQLQA